MQANTKAKPKDTTQTLTQGHAIRVRDQTEEEQWNTKASCDEQIQKEVNEMWPLRSIPKALRVAISLSLGQKLEIVWLVDVCGI